MDRTAKLGRGIVYMDGEKLNATNDSMSGVRAHLSPLQVLSEGPGLHINVDSILKIITGDKT